MNADGIKYSPTLTREQTFEIRGNGFLRNDSAIENSHTYMQNTSNSFLHSRRSKLVD